MQQAQAVPGKLLKLTCAVAMSGMTLCPGGEADRSVTARVVRTRAASSGDDLDRAEAMMLLSPLCICPFSLTGAQLCSRLCSTQESMPWHGMSTRARPTGLSIHQASLLLPQLQVVGAQSHPQGSAR